MALPIAATPTLTGETARKFADAAEKRQPTTMKKRVDPAKVLENILRIKSGQKHS